MKTQITNLRYRARTKSENSVHEPVLSGKPRLRVQVVYPPDPKYPVRPEPVEGYRELRQSDSAIPPVLFG